MYKRAVTDDPSRETLRTLQALHAEATRRAQKFEARLLAGEDRPKLRAAHDRHTRKAAYYAELARIVRLHARLDLAFPLRMYLTNTRVLYDFGFRATVDQSDPDLYRLGQTPGQYVLTVPGPTDDEALT
jgi:hypothetical protein